MISKLWLLALAFLMQFTCFAQFNETIVSDRPGQSNSPNTVGKKVLQFQSGLQLDGSKADNYRRHSFSWPVLVRFGITENVDIITVWGYQNSAAKYFDLKFKTGGINISDIGLRFNIFEETENAPALGFEAYYKAELTSEDFKRDYPSAKLNLMVSKSFSDIFSITSNLGLDVYGVSGGSNGFFTLNFVFPISNEISVFFENYGDFTYEEFNTYFDFGGGYLLNPDLQLDIVGGFGYNDDVFSYQIGAGVSYRITKW